MSNCGFVELSITDGTVVIDLLGANRHGSGFGVQRYTPGRPQLKNGGVWADSPLAVGRQLVAGIDSNIADAVTLVCGGPDQDQIIRHFEELDLLLAKAQAYWTTTWQQTPVYLRARAKGETARRYALIHYAKYDEYFNPYGELFAGDGSKVATEEFILGIERGPWLDLPPGQSESVPITHEKNSGDPTEASGSVLTNEGLIVGNMHQATDEYGATGGLLSILRDDGGSFSGNLLDGSPPYNLINSPEATNDAFYMGGQNPFFGVVFNLTNLSAGSTRVWEYWDGAAWDSFTPRTNASNTVLAATGVTHAAWSSSDIGTWTKTTVSTAPYLYWIRVRTTSGGAGGPLTQGTRHVYATSINYIEVSADEIVGTQNALAKMDINLWHTNTAGNYSEITGPFVYVGLRSVDRGERFAAQLNVWGGNPTGIEFNRGGFGTLVNNDDEPGGASITVTNSSLSSRSAFITFSAFDGIHAHYFGRFRLFVRLHSNDETGSCQARYQIMRPVRVTPTIIISTGETKAIPATPFASTYRNMLVDLGTITLPGSSRALYSESTGNITIGLDFAVPSGKTVTIVNVILLPVDEWVAEIDGKLTNDPDALQIRLDGVGNPKSARAYVEQADDLLAVTKGLPFISAGARQRFWFVFRAGSLETRPDFCASVRLGTVQRNISLRSST